MKLHSFSVGNFKSFLGVQTIAFNFDKRNTNVIYGPNGSGKSNLFQAIQFYRDFIRNSTKFEGQNLGYQNFLLSAVDHEIPTTLAALFSTDKFIYKYEFSILGNRVVNEYLQRKRGIRNSSFETIFRRLSVDKGRYEKYGFDSVLMKSTRPDALLLTKAWENNNKIANDIFIFLEHLKLINNHQNAGATAQKIATDDKYRLKVLELLQNADLFIQDVAAFERDMPEEIVNKLPLSDVLKAKLDRRGYEIVTSHFVHDDRGVVSGVKKLSMVAHESMGTKRIFELAYPLIDTLERGNTLYVDDFEIYLHPRETAFIIDLFATRNNPKGAQLIVNTHNTKIFDQVGKNNVHLFGKNNREETIIGSIPGDIRATDTALEKKYDKGLFGAVPNIKGS